MKNYTMRLTAGLRREIKAAAKDAGVSESFVVRMCLRHGLPAVKEILKYQKP